MGSYVIHKGRVGTAHGAAGMKAQEFGPCLLPFPSIAALATVGPGAVKAALAFKLTGDLAGA